MPFYEYECSTCGHCLEAMQKISDGPLKKCPECSRNTLKRLMSAPVFRLKGGGWYADLYSSSGKSSGGSSGGSGSSSESKSGGESSSAPAAAPAAPAPAATPTKKD